MKYSALSVVLMASVFFGLGCNPLQNVQDKIEKKVAEGVTEKIVESAAGGKVDVDLKGDNEVVMKDNKTGGYVAYGEDVTIPAEFPSAIPRYSGAKATSVSLTGKDEGGASLSLVTADDAEKVTSWYAERMKADGWDEAQSMSIGAMETRVYEKGDETVTLSITKSEEGEGDGRTVIYIVYAVKKAS